MVARILAAVGVILIGLLIVRWDRSIEITDIAGSFSSVSTPASLSEGAFSSVFCEGISLETRRCRVTNLCYLPGEQQFVMLYSERDSLYTGIKNSSDLNPLLKLNPVIGHNLFDLSLIPVTSSWVRRHDAVLHRGSFLLLEPFKQDNLMHVLHDDLLPMFVTLQHICSGDILGCFGVDWRLLLHSTFLPEHMVALYAALSSGAPLLTGVLSEDTPHCFQHVHLGLRADTLWYQFGFSQPQAPLSTTDAQPKVFSQFRDMVLKSLDTASSGEEMQFTQYSVANGKWEHFQATGDDDEGREGSASQQYVLLVSRTQSRRLLNEDALAAELARRLRLPIRRVALEESGVVNAVRLASSASLLVGMHGAGLALAVFLPSGSAVLELFPYGLHPRRYQPYRRLCQLRGLGYRAWRNRDLAASVPPPKDAAPDLGGLKHLSPAEQQRIQQLAEVPDTLCCDDPSFLYWAYQDMMVEVTSAAEAAAAALRRPSETSEKDVAPLWFPGPVRNVTAETGDGVRMVQWRKPVCAASRLRYRLWVQQGESVTEHVTRQSHLTLPSECTDCPLLVWVRAEFADRRGVLVHHRFELT